MKPDKSFTLALGYLSRSPKTIFEMKRYLKKKSIGSREIEATINRLVELKYLDDTDFASQFIDNRIRFKPKSVYALGYELRQKGVAPKIADELLENLDDAELAWSALKKKERQLHHLDPDTQKKKLMNHLRYRGFDHSVSRLAIERFLIGS